MAKEREKVGWRVPASEYNRFHEYAQETHPSDPHAVTRELITAMEEYIDADDLPGVEAQLDNLLDRAGYASASASKEKIVARVADDGERWLVNMRVPADLKAAFRRAADGWEVPYGVALARAMRERRDGGRAQRLADKLDRLAPTVEGALDDLAKSSASGTAMDVTKRKTIAICRELGDEFTRDEFRQALDDAPVNVSDTPHCRDRYLQRVLDRREYEAHPINPDVFVPKQDAETYRAGKQAQQNSEAEAEADDSIANLMDAEAE